MRADPELQSPVWVEGTDYTMARLLALLKKATGLDLTVDPQLDKHEPDFGHLQLPKVASWSVMQLIASRQLEEGRWLKTTYGYELTAKQSLVQPPPKGKPKAKLSSLRVDPALQVEVTLTGPGLTLAALMAGVQKATGLRLNLDPQLGDHQPVFQQELHKGPAWAIMQMMAVKQLTEGRWLKTADGYQLTASESKFPKAQAEKKAFEESQVKGAKESAKYIEWQPLGLDPTLHAKLTVVQDHISLPDLLERLRAATGLNLVLADALTHHDPDLGGIYLPNVAAYPFMELIADKDLDNGRWEKTEDGYRLTGVSKALRPSPRPSFWLVATAGGGAALVLVGGVLVIRGRRTELNSF